MSKPTADSGFQFPFDLGDVFEAEFGDVGDGLDIYLAIEHALGGLDDLLPFALLSTAFNTLFDTLFDTFLFDECDDVDHIFLRSQFIV